ncbi:MAG: M18 family aminopeptidase [Desulfocapsaceae bacterium]|nr:M18 family aminopeptidase [Desulfocapsaceae bacterium]
MDTQSLNEAFFNFLTASPTPFHAVSAMAERFRSHGFIPLREQENWQLSPGNSYFVVREDGALIAFSLGSESPAAAGFRILGAHSDSPSLQIKPRPDARNQQLHQLGVEIYGGALLSPWFDRPLSIAGRVSCRIGDTLQTLLLDFRQPLLIIPSLAIHLDRKANSNRSINAQLHMVPIISHMISETFPDFKAILKDQIAREYPEKNAAEILGFDMFCYDWQPPCLLGLNNDFISAGRLDNLLSCFVGMQAMLEARGTGSRMFICNNHEETGSMSATGAQGSFPLATLERIIPDVQSRQISLSRSFFISMDNAHGGHPNFTDKADPLHTILLNHGPVIKINANQRYATSSFSKAVFQLLADEVQVKTQEFVMRNDMACGSTIGPLIASRLGVPTVDVGAPSLAMHSIRELTGSSDPSFLHRIILHFLNREHLPGEKR